MKYLCTMRVALLAAFLAGFAHQALAVPVVVLDNPRVAREILKLDVLGTLYDVTFNNVADNTFLGDTAGATAARDAINAALNSTAADLVRILSTGVSVNNFGVRDGGSTTVRGVSFSVPMNWQPSASTALAAPIAQFRLHVPEPATLALMGLALVGLRHRRAQS